MSSQSESGDRMESLGIRRSVELPESDVDAAGDLAPAAESDGPAEEAAGSSAADEAGRTGTSEKSSADTTAPPEKDTKAIAAPEMAVPPAAGDTAAGDDEMPPDRPKKTVLAGVAIGGAVVLAIPILLIGTGNHHGKKHPTAAAAATVLPGDGVPPGAFTSTSPTPTPSPSTSAKKKVKPKESKKPAKKKVVAAAKKSGFAGVSNVLLKNSASGLCADVPGYGRGSTDGPVAQYYCALGDADNQVWSLGVMRDMKGPGGTALFTIRNTTDDYCMDLPGYSGVSAGTKVTEYYCRPKNDNQLWYRSHTRGHLYRIRNYSSHGLCLGPTGRSHARDKQLEIHACGSGDEWSWPSGE
ncbi:RICIN domain-containing protein [Actinomadura sp. DC4]|uniref:RICIN domain-containing protein n=1 Tax=Actinomadura sp. DC4 TaxID=3055069 RepID=UPI0025B273CD|nr:RICIN domain-containing protein [Actinomadura sp. DC4]MDN3354822.1 RICIN domain-containing protein [Actinomadura sp. DC4]